MTLHRIQFVTFALVLFTLFFSAGTSQPALSDVAVTQAASVKTSSAVPPADWTFEGCWTQFSAGQCRDVFRDQQGNYWICRACGTTGNPSPGKCSPISAATLASGFWCS
jgi:hypothetical protein